jgi:hypothetical protein
MLWYLELLLESALLTRLCLNRDPRKYFQAFVAVDLLGGILSMLGQRLHFLGFSAHAWWIATIACVPLMALSLNEASERRHRLLLFWWVAFGYGCAWIRIFPLTNQVLLVGNCLAFIAWLYMAY